MGGLITMTNSDTGVSSHHERVVARGWNNFLSERDKQIFSQSGYGRRMGMGRSPALLIVDVNYDFCGDSPEPIEQSVQRFHNSCGDIAWTALDHIQQVLDVTRRKRLPVIYTTRAQGKQNQVCYGRWLDKSDRYLEHADRNLDRIVPIIEPQQEDILIRKDKPSAFYGTPLASYLIELNIDTLLVCGTTTSGCVRATVVDAFSMNYRVGIILECTFDRGEASHWINLFDMDQKYADVMTLENVTDYVESIPGKGTS
jgi:nicotinamidase-related amidase